MLISMPTGTSTIFGAFQAIRFSQVVLGAMWRRAKVKATSNIAQVFTLWLCVAQGLRLTRSELLQHQERTTSIVATVPVQRGCLAPWHPGFHPYPDLPH